VRIALAGGAVLARQLAQDRLQILIVGGGGGSSERSG
jgi:hypothetical protein